MGAAGISVYARESAFFNIIRRDNGSYGQFYANRDVQYLVVGRVVE